MRSSSRLLSSSKSETQGQLSGCEGAIRSHFGLLHLTRGTTRKSKIVRKDREGKRNKTIGRLRERGERESTNSLFGEKLMKGGYNIL